MVTQKRSGQADLSRRGAILVWSAVIMTFLLAMTAFAVDISYMTVVATQLQNAADAAALSAVVELTNGHAAVIATARDVASKNKATTEEVVINDADVEFGWFDLPTRTFTAPSENADGAAEDLGMLMQKACGRGRLYVWIPLKWRIPVLGEKVLEWCWKPMAPTSKNAA